jgi:hypothetical protein
LKVVLGLLPAVLDVPCGDGRLTLPLARAGYEATEESRYTFEDEHGTVERSGGAHHVHTTGEVVRLLHAAGFEDVELRGPDGRTRYELGDRRMIAVAA